MTLLMSVIRNGLGVSDGMNFSQKGNITRHIYGTVRVSGGGVWSQTHLGSTWDSGKFPELSAPIFPISEVETMPV